MKRTDRKSACPVNFSLEILGDQWSMLIVRDIALFGRHTFKDFLEAGERITTSVLSDRLANLTKHGIIRKEPHPSDGRRDHYFLTGKGIDLIPAILELMAWGTGYDAKSSGHRKESFVERIRTERGAVIEEVKEKVRKGGAAFVEKTNGE
jgi:DNA-binding HxlR family transcriptional regulator